MATYETPEYDEAGQGFDPGQATADLPSETDSEASYRRSQTELNRQRAIMERQQSEPGQVDDSFAREEEGLPTLQAQQQEPAQQPTAPQRIPQQYLGVREIRGNVSTTNQWQNPEYTQWAQQNPELAQKAQQRVQMQAMEFTNQDLQRLNVLEQGHQTALKAGLRLPAEGAAELRKLKLKRAAWDTIQQQQQQQQLADAHQQGTVLDSVASSVAAKRHIQTIKEIEKETGQKVKSYNGKTESITFHNPEKPEKDTGAADKALQVRMDRAEDLHVVGWQKRYDRIAKDVDSYLTAGVAAGKITHENAYGSGDHVGKNRNDLIDEALQRAKQPLDEMEARQQFRDKHNTHAVTGDVAPTAQPTQGAPQQGPPSGLQPKNTVPPPNVSLPNLEAMQSRAFNARDGEAVKAISLIKDIYRAHPTLTGLSEEETKSFLQATKIAQKHIAAPTPTPPSKASRREPSDYYGPGSLPMTTW